MSKLKYTVGTIRSSGLEARWTRTRSGAPILAAREPGKANGWYVIDREMWQAMRKEGIRPAFERFTLLGDVFSIPA